MRFLFKESHLIRIDNARKLILLKLNMFIKYNLNHHIIFVYLSAYEKHTLSIRHLFLEIIIKNMAPFKVLPSHAVIKMINTSFAIFV